MEEAREVREITVKELVESFKGKHVNISPMDHYGISIDMKKATLELEDDKSELWFVLRDDEDKVTTSICIDEDSIETIEEYEDDTYAIHFSLNMTSVDISESLEK